MPLYELMLVLKPMPKSGVVECLKRAANIVWNENGVLRKIDYLGFNKLPFAAFSQADNCRYNEGSYFLYYMSLGSSKLRNLNPELKLEMDILNYSINLANESKIPEDYQCTLEEELLPPAFRKSVRPLLDDKNVITDIRRWVVTFETIIWFSKVEAKVCWSEVLTIKAGK